MSRSLRKGASGGPPGWGNAIMVGIVLGVAYPVAWYFTTSGLSLWWALELSLFGWLIPIALVGWRRRRYRKTH
jgi:hypothetical protein